MTDADLTLEPEAAERDANTSDMFGAPASASEASVEAVPGAVSGPAGAYTVLARKYRPRTFEDLIGQEAMVRTLTNAFAAGRIAHAFMLTGVRGVGKTTTARLLARALNYDFDTVHQPSVDLSVEGLHCRAIIEGRHMDVLELDAATRTKVDDMRELLDGVRYAPVQARNKVYVIDEVHMLSTAAFNALLKTLEEPPPHAKFIFATTEIRKVPVTILSRCQRFDLRRVEPEVLTGHLERICAREAALVESEGLKLIARAAEGSVRDSLSLLDQALVQAEAGQIVKADVVRDMLGLADRAQTIALLESVLSGKIAEALEQFRALYGFGADPAQVASDLLEHVHGATIARTLGPAATRLPNDQAARLAALGAQVSAGTLARVWQMLLKAYDEVRRAPDPAAAMEMALVRLAYASDLPGPEEALKRLQAGQPVVGRRRPGRAGAVRRRRRRRDRVGPRASAQARPAAPADLRAGRGPDRGQARHLAEDRRGALRAPGRVQAGRHRLRARAERARRPAAPPRGQAQGVDRPGLAGGRPGRRGRREPLRARAPRKGRGPRPAGGGPLRPGGDEGLPRDRDRRRARAGRRSHPRPVHRHDRRGRGGLSGRTWAKTGTARVRARTFRAGRQGARGRLRSRNEASP